MTWLWPALGLLLAALRAPWFTLNGDVRYSLGVLSATREAGWEPWQVWTHRPLANRLLMDGLERLMPDHGRPGELITLMIAGVLAGMAALVLHRGLSGRLPAAGGLAVGVLFGMVWAPARDIWQPEWVAAVLAVAAVGVGVRAGAAATWTSALLLSLSALQKYSTATTAAIAGLALVALAPRRALTVGPAAVVTTVALLGLSLLIPHERQWFLDMPSLNSAQTDPWQCLPGDPATRCPAASMSRSLGLVTPALLLWPATTVLVAALSGLRRVWVLLVVPGWIVLAGLGVLAQQSWYTYQVTVLGVLAAGWCGWAAALLARRDRRAGALLPALALLIVAAANWSLSSPVHWRTTDLDARDVAWTVQVVALFAALAVVAVALTRLGDRPGGARWPAVVTAALLTVTPILPWTPQSFDFQFVDRTPSGELVRTRRLQADAAALQHAIPPGEPVLQLSFGEETYFVDRPSRCRYAAATVLQRNRWTPTTQLPSYSENMACLSDPRVRWVVLSPGWLGLQRTGMEAVRAAVGAGYDCDRGIRTVMLTACPRR